MTVIDLPALDGRKPLGFLAGLGVTRLLDRFSEQTPLLAWDRSSRCAQLHCDLEFVDNVAMLLARIAAAIPDGGVLPAVPVDLPPPGAAPDGIRLAPGPLASLVERLAPDPDEEVESWVASLVTDLSLDGKGRSDITLMAAPSGRQSMRTMLEKPLEFIRDRPEAITEALVQWRRYPGVTGEYLDHQVLFDAADSGSGTSEERGVPGATWLALMSYPLLRTTAQGGLPVTTGWHRRGRGQPTFLYPLWSEPLDCEAIVAMLEHPIWGTAAGGPLPDECTALSVFELCWARRRRISGRTFAGVLGPLP